LGNNTIPKRGAIISAKRPSALARLALPILGGVLGVLAPLLYARGQAPQAGGEPKVRILSVSTPPLTDEQLPEGGLVLALVKASLEPKAGTAPKTDAKADVRWTKGALNEEILSDQTLDLFLPVETADCDRPNELTQTSAVVCDHAVYSEPILQVVLGLFSLTNGSFKFDTDESILGKTVCVWREHDLSALNANGRNWASYKRLTVLRRTSLLDCVVAVQAYDADAFVAIDLEGTYLLRRLGLAPYFVMHPRPLATRGVHAVVARDHPRAAEILAALNAGLQRLKQGGAYASLVQKHLMASEPAPVVTASATAPPKSTPPQSAPPPKTTAPKTTAPPTTAPTGGASKQASLPPTAVKEATAPTKAAPLGASPPGAKAESKATPVPAPVPVLDPASRAVALKFLKRGDEELADGRVAPARLLYERAAEMGLAQAAMALAGTYDAAELAKPHLLNVVPDPVEAKRWYERAKMLGAAEAVARLQRLGSTDK
jgi:hypothetical protein